MRRRGLRIAVIGSRGIPAGYGGFETFIEELAPRLVGLGNDVTVYCQADYTDRELREYEGVRLVHTPYLRKRDFEQLSHEFTSIVDSFRRPFDLYYFLGYRGAPMYTLLRLGRRPVVVNTDGFEWKRSKWNRLGRAYLRSCEWIVARGGADHLVSDAMAVRDYFLETYGKDSEYLTNGAHLFTRQDDLPEGALDEWNLEPDGYHLLVCRIQPDNNVHLTLEGYIESGSQRPLVVVGGMNYQTPYWEHLQRIAARGNVRFLGPIYGSMLVERLHLGCYSYLHGHEMGGTNPSLLKAMGCGNLCLALGTVFNRENLADTGIFWDKRPASLAEKIRWADANHEEGLALGERARRRIQEHYTWDSVAEAHDRFFRSITG